LHHFAIDPTINTLSLFVTYMGAHINPQSVNNYLSGVCSLLEEYYSQVQANQYSCLSNEDMEYLFSKSFPFPNLSTALVSVPIPPSHGDLLFIAQLFDGFYGLLHLGKLVWPDNTHLCSQQKLSLQMSVILSKSYHSFILHHHKSDTQFEGSTVLVQHDDVADPHGVFISYLASQDKMFPFNSFLWLCSGGSIPTWVWFIKHL
ncbi:hypothetical protein BDR04DRAFT_1214509, partial [Suillus decipiens]